MEDIKRIVAVGGGTKGSLWTQVVSDITARSQEVRQQSIGASYGSALLLRNWSVTHPWMWNPVAQLIAPRPQATARARAVSAHRELYTVSADVAHALAARQQRRPTRPIPRAPATEGAS